MFAICGVWTTFFGTVSYRGADLIIAAMIATMATTLVVILTPVSRNGAEMERP
jgi:hypothetical protein